MSRWKEEHFSIYLPSSEHTFHRFLSLFRSSQWPSVRLAGLFFGAPFFDPALRVDKCVVIYWIALSFRKPFGCLFSSEQDQREICCCYKRRRGKMWFLTLNEAIAVSGNIYCFSKGFSFSTITQILIENFKKIIFKIYKIIICALCILRHSHSLQLKLFLTLPGTTC